MIARRTVLQGALAAAGSCVAPFARAAAELTTLTDSIRVISGLGGNIVHALVDDTAIVVDSGAAEHSAELTALLAELPGNGRVGILFNTHWHLDQVGGNASLRRAGAEIIAHAKTLAHLSIPYYLPDEDRYRQPLPPDAHPTISFRTVGVIGAASTTISYGYLLEAHTDGDIYVRFNDANVIAAGDAISPLRDPEFDWYGGGWLGGRIDSLERLLAVSDAATRFVPSYGPVVDRAYVESEHRLMLGLYDIMWERFRAGESADDIHRSGALDSLPRRFDDPAKLLYDAHKSLWAHYNTLSPDIV